MFAFIMPDVGDEDALVVVEEIVVAHVGRHIELRACLDCLVKQETARATTQRKSRDDAGRVTAIAYGAHLKGLLDPLKHLACGRGFDIADDAATGCGACHVAIRGDIVAVEELHTSHPQFVGHAERHTLPGTVHIGVGAVDGDVVLDGHGHGALHGRAAHDLFQTVENEWVVGDDQIETAVNGLGDNRLGGIGAQEHASDVGLGVAHLDTCIVPLLLQSQGGILLDGIGYLSDFHF